MASGNNYVIQVKGNQKTLYREIQRTMVEELPLDIFTIEEKGHERTWETFSMVGKCF